MCVASAFIDFPLTNRSRARTRTQGSRERQGGASGVAGGGDGGSSGSGGGGGRGGSGSGGSSGRGSDNPLEYGAETKTQSTNQTRDILVLSFRSLCN